MRGPQMVASPYRTRVSAARAARSVDQLRPALREACPLPIMGLYRMGQGGQRRPWRRRFQPRELVELDEPGKTCLQTRTVSGICELGIPRDRKIRLDALSPTVHLLLAFGRTKGRETNMSCDTASMARKR